MPALRSQRFAPRPRRGVAIAAVVLAITSACSTGSERTDSPSRGADSTLDWERCGRVECATLDVPLDPADPNGPTIELALARRPADGERIGSLLVNPGGPGSPGIFLVEEAELTLPDDVLASFDVVGWDPRGTGESTPFDCTDDLDAFWGADRTPDDAHERAELERIAAELVAGCVERSADLLEHLSSAASVADMDAIRAALGEESITYLGFSYGTFLGARYADQHPQRVRAMVLDGAVDPSLGYEEVALEQGEGFDAALGAFFDWCDERESCDLGVSGDAATDFDALVRAVDAEPVRGDGRRVGSGELEIGVVSALYGGDEAYDLLGAALSDLRRGDGGRILALADVYSGRLPDGSYTNDTEAFFATGCLDSEVPATVEELAAVADEVGAVAPRLGPSGVWLGLPCVLWPVEPQLRAAPIRARGAPPILVLGTLGDPATPPEWAGGLADQLDSGVLVSLDAAGHMASGRGVACVDDIVARYLVDLEVPAAGARCAA